MKIIHLYSIIKTIYFIKKAIIKIIDEYIKPSVAMDGGNILFKNYHPKEKLVEVVLQGACSGCPSSTITLKNGIEKLLNDKNAFMKASYSSTDVIHSNLGSSTRVVRSLIHD